MESFMNLAETGPTDVGIDLGGRDVGVTQHQLHGTQVRTTFKLVRGEGVAQRVGTNTLEDPGLSCVRSDTLPEGLAGQAPAVSS